MRKKDRIPPSSVGAAMELRVAADLLMKGFEVFRALSPSCSCDLVIQRDGKLLRVESRKGFLRAEGKPEPCTRRHNADVLAIVLPDKIIYQPELPERPQPWKPTPIPIEGGFYYPPPTRHSQSRSDWARFWAQGKNLKFPPARKFRVNL